MAYNKPLKKISAKWSDRASVSEDDYKDGIANPVKDWETGALAGDDNYEKAIVDSMKRKARPAGIKRVGTKGWQEPAIKKSERWAPGIAGALDQFEEGYEPYHATYERLKLDPRYPAGDVRNYKRSAQVGTAFHQKKLDLQK